MTITQGVFCDSCGDKIGRVSISVPPTVLLHQVKVTFQCSFCHVFGGESENKIKAKMKGKSYV